jgi:hypothetical protein
MMRSGPMVSGRSAMVTTPGTFNRNHVAWGSHDHDHDRFHHRFHNRFFAFGFAGPYYDYAYNSCGLKFQLITAGGGFMCAVTTRTKNLGVDS